MTSFEPNFLSLIADKLIELINNCDDEYFPKHLLFRNLGLCLIMNSTNSNVKYEIALLNGVWKTVTKFTEPSVLFSLLYLLKSIISKTFFNLELHELCWDMDRIYAQIFQCNFKFHAFINLTQAYLLSIFRKKRLIHFLVILLSMFNKIVLLRAFIRSFNRLWPKYWFI